MVVNTPGPQRTARSHDSWAADVLGLPNYAVPLQRTLKSEVDAYLLDSQFGTMSLNFWQVSKPFYVSSDMC